MISYTRLYEQKQQLTCQEDFCEGVRWLNEEELAAPAKCILCSKRICDTCAFGVRIPYDVLGEKPWTWKEHYQYCWGVRDHGAGMCHHDKPTDGQRYDALVCRDCFKEEWV